MAKEWLQKSFSSVHSPAEHSSASNSSMPIHCPVDIKPLDAATFEALDFRVVGHACACQNELGCLCDECAYQADLKARLQADGFRPVSTEVPVTVTHRDFSRKHYLDL